MGVIRNLYGSKKSDPVEAGACARYALSERPAAQTNMPTFAWIAQWARRATVAGSVIRMTM